MSSYSASRACGGSDLERGKEEKKTDLERAEDGAVEFARHVGLEGREARGPVRGGGLVRLLERHLVEEEERVELLLLEPRGFRER